MDYQKLPSEDSPEFDSEDTGNKVKKFSKDLKKYKNSNGPEKFSLENDLNKLKEQILTAFKKPKVKKEDKQKKEAFEKQFKLVNEDFEKNKSNGLNSDTHADPDLDENIVEQRGLAFKDSVELNYKKLSDRKENIETLQKDFVQVNEMFKDTAMMVKEQGIMLEEVDKNADIAVKETGKGVDELCKANIYQKKAKNKLNCILIIVTIVVIVLVVALLLGLKIIAI